MRVRKLALAVGLVSALVGNGALALGLGEIKLNSTLNQPLEAEINLLQTRGLSDGEIKVRLASPEDFERAGVDRSYLLTELDFDVDFSSAQPKIRISSHEPIREPFLNFLVETRWPSGRLLREYTLLMDLPAFAEKAAPDPVRAAPRERQQVRREPARPSVQTSPAPQTAEPVVESVPAPEPAAEPRAEEQPPADEPLELSPGGQAGSSQVYGPVVANQTLWQIALDSRPDRRLSVQQTMLAIQRLNPEAFIDNNINLLKRGVVLRLPSADDIRNLTRTQAIAQVAVQNDSWRGRGVGGEVATGAPLDGRAVVGETASSDTLEGRVSLAAPGDNESVLSGSGSGAEDSEALSGELAVAEEELDKQRLENAELQERISELDEQIDTMERMVEVSNEEMQAIQTAAEQSNAVEEESPGADTGEVPVQEADEAEMPTATEEVPAIEEPVENIDRNRVVSVQTKPEPTLLDWAAQHMRLIGIGAAILLAGLFGFFSWRRRREEEKAMREIEAEMAAERALADAPSADDRDENLAAVESFEAASDLEMDDLGGIGTDDPIAEAEIHLSLGQYREAENKLLAGLEQSPQNIDARLMLLEVYANAQDLDKFDSHYRELLAVSDGPAADRAAHLREGIAGAPPFEAPAMDLSSESLEAAQLDDISASLGEDVAPVEADEGSSLLDDLMADIPDESRPAQDPAGEEEFSLDLGLESDVGGSIDDTDEQQLASAEEFNLDDLIPGGLDLEGNEGLESEPAGGATEILHQGDADSGLDFDLDLSPIEGGEAIESGSGEMPTLDLDGDFTPDTAVDPAPQEADETTEELETFGVELDGELDLDLDSINLDDIAADLPQDGDLAVAPETRAEAAQPVQDSSAQEAPAEDLGADLGDLGFDLEGDLDSELNLLDGGDEVGTKLELAQAYLDMGDKDGARDILAEVVEEASGDQQTQAREMLERLA
ncbi:FimV/HubP family polar landmark protein [Microbulbifer sp. TYP-18]|uniref:FimV/HubP family polar landmark protein n=1 Tax=Microbulbifer sp. TYP-18 TaxID=3230024 RepID=UPI0034C5B2BA